MNDIIFMMIYLAWLFYETIAEQLAYRKMRKNKDLFYKYLMMR